MYTKCIPNFNKFLNTFCIRNLAVIVVLTLYTKCIQKFVENVGCILYTFCIPWLYTSCTVFVYKMYTQFLCGLTKKPYKNYTKRKQKSYKTLNLYVFYIQRLYKSKFCMIMNVQKMHIRF